MTLSFQAERREVQRKDSTGKEPCRDPSAYKACLGAARLGPIDGEVKKLAMKITGGKKTVLSMARSIYDRTCSNMYRDPNTRGCGTCILLRNPGGKCTDISSVTIALCRVVGVPASEIFGIRLGKKAEEDIMEYQHCWLEFYLPGRVVPLRAYPVWGLIHRGGRPGWRPYWWRAGGEAASACRRFQLQRRNQSQRASEARHPPEQHTPGGHDCRNTGFQQYSGQGG